MFGRIIVSITLLFVILLVTLPDSDEKSKSKIASASMLMCSKEFRSDVAAQLEKEGEVKLRFDNKCPGLIDELHVDMDGVMVISNHEHNIKMTLRPVVEEATVLWSCRGEPQERVTAFCKALAGTKVEER